MLMHAQNETIFLKQALDIMSRRDVNGQPIPFDCAVRTFNRTTKKGGRLKTYSGARLLPLSSGEGHVKEENIKSLENIPLAAKNPNHFENRTRNIKTSTGKTRTINLNFLIKVDGTAVSY